MIINWKPDKSMKVPLHIQIIDYTKKMIMTGNWVCGERLPSQRKLADLFEVNRSTISTAMDELKFQGFIRTNGKGGTFIATKAWSTFEKSSNNMLNNLLSSGLLKRKSKLYKQIEESYASIKVDFGKGELDKSLYPETKMKQMMYKAIDEINQLPYENKNGDKELIEKIKRKMIAMGVDMQENDVLIVSGATQGLFIVVLGMLSQENIIKTNIPCYIKSLEIFKAAGLDINDIMDNKNGRYKVFYMIPTFHNPTGKLMNSNERETFMNKYGRHNPIIEDDVFRDLWYDEEPPNPLKSYSGGESVIYINSFSKTLAPGLRVGWICASKDIINKLREIKYQMDSGTSLINQKIVLKWLDSCDYNENLELVRMTLKKRRDLMEQILVKDFKNIFLWKKPSGGYYYWLKSKDKIKALSIFEKSLEYGLVVHPGELYGEEDSCCIRVSFAFCKEDKIKEGFVILKNIMNELKYGL